MVWKLVLPILVGIELAITDRQITWGIIIVRVKTHGNTNTRKNMQNKSGLQLVSGLEHEFYDFPYIGNFIIPTDELHHCSEGPVNHHWRSPSLFRGVAIPPTRQWWTPKAIAVQLRSAMEGSFDPISVCLITWFPYGFVWKSSIPPRTRMLTRMLMVMMSKHMEMQSSRALFWNSSFTQSCTFKV